MDFGIFYFANATTDQNDGYKLLKEGVQFADEVGLTSVWTPERHFHKFGGLYPNPAVTSAAIAAWTSRIQIRAGSVVAPLHDPVRIAEDWSLVDNISNGRIGIAFASGWHATDFALGNGRYEDRRTDMTQAIDTVHRLWRGESVELPDGNGDPVEIRTYPRPIQERLPMWITSSGSIDSFRTAGRMGAGLLTHLLGQDIPTLTDKINIYRQEWSESGRAGRGHVALMLHTFLGEDRDTVKNTVRAPFSDYLASSFDLVIKAVDGAGDTDAARALATMTGADRRFLIDQAFDRYFDTSGLFGNVEDGLSFCDQLRAAGVDEVACLIDFGVSSSEVLSGLRHLGELHEQWKPHQQQQRAMHV